MELNIGAPTSFSRNQEVFGEGEPAEYLYRLKSGCIRTYSTFRDGRRQVASFYLPGEYFGLEQEKVHSFSAEAVTPSLVYVMKRTVLMKRTAASNKVTSRLLALTALELRRTQRHVLLLLKSARERVSQFLLEMAEREQMQKEIQLPMTRQDIADYLGITIETVSRVLMRLENAAAISLPSPRRVVLRDRSLF
jgi:CRP/FNR family transcriptional regulator, nitrogen fixation regulation protein